MSQRNNPFSDSLVTNQINIQTPKAYNINLYDHLQQGNSVNFVQAKALGITQLDSRIAEIRKITNVYARTIRINAVKCTEYSLQPFA